MFVTFTVQVKDTEYAYQGTEGQAKLEIELAEPIVSFIEPSRMFMGLLGAALTNFHETLEEKEIQANLQALEEKEKIDEAR